ncbi:MAG: substrate-binding periplasmic protein [Parvibaculaceae bacterium]
MIDDPRFPIVSRRSALKTLGLGAVSLVGANSLLSSRHAFADAPEIQTLEKGYITAACLGEMPLTGERDGKPIGTDLEMLTLIGDRVGLKVKIVLMGFPGVIEAVKAGRADWFGGNFAWTPARSKILQLTDAAFYTGAYVIMRESEPYTDKVTVADFKGRSIGTGTGFSVVPDMKKVPGTTELKLYDTTDSCLRDVIAGRLDFAVLDAPIIDYIIQQNPDFKLKQLPLAPDPELPTLTSKFSAIWGIDPKNYDLFDAINQGLGWLHKSGQAASILTKYGIGNPDYLVPVNPNPRVGVDRDEDGKPIGTFGHTPRDFSSYFA